jgi:Uma2 family endonuclease
MPVRTRSASRTSVLIPRTDWQTYSRLLRAFAERPGVRLTYDRGVLEIMSPRLRHDDPSSFLGRLVCTLTEELGMPIKQGGSTTLRRRRKQRGLEPDHCFWIANEPAMRTVRDLDLRIHPPPDLAIEVDVSNSSLDRMSIYATLGVTEVWRLDEPSLTFHVLGSGGLYDLVTHSRTFPQVTPADLMRFLILLGREEENAIVRQFRAWVRQLAPSPCSPFVLPRPAVAGQ